MNLVKNYKNVQQIILSGRLLLENKSPEIKDSRASKYRKPQQKPVTGASQQKFAASAPSAAIAEKFFPAFSTSAVNGQQMASVVDRQQMASAATIEKFFPASSEQKPAIAVGRQQKSTEQQIAFFIGRQQNPSAVTTGKFFPASSGLIPLGQKFVIVVSSKPASSAIGQKLLINSLFTPDQFLTVVRRSPRFE